MGECSHAQGGAHCCSPVPQVESVQDSVREKLQLVQQGEAESLEEKDRNELKKRKLLMEV